MYQNIYLVDQKLNDSEVEYLSMQIHITNRLVILRLRKHIKNLEKNHITYLGAKHLSKTHIHQLQILFLGNKFFI